MANVEDNRNLVFEDELALISTAIKSTKRRPVFLDKHNTQKKYVRYDKSVIVSDGSRCGILASQAYIPSVSRQYPNGVVLYNLEESDNIDGLADDIVDNTVIYFFIDTYRVKLSQRVIPAFEKVVDIATKRKDIRIVLTAVVPEPKGLPKGVNAVAEREYDYLLETCAQMKSKATDYTLAIHRCARAAVRDYGVSVTVLRATNLFGPGATGIFAKAMNRVVDQCCKTKHVTIADADYRLVVSATLTSDLVSAAFWAVRNAVAGHEFNVTSYKFSLATFKRRIFESFSTKFSISDSCSALDNVSYRCLSELKFLGTRWRKYQQGKIDLSSAIKRMVCARKGYPFVYGNTISVYEGKLPQIKAVEMIILREIDRICRKHDIKYFLAGGTLLGAVRHNSSIPWDDDFDIGFLRKDFDKFRKACDEELQDPFIHSCYYNGTDSHYMVDKIRMKNTYFSTRYSSIHAVEDGVFVDCLVYDATFENKFLAKIHDKLCGIFGNLVQAHWREYRRDEVGSRFRWLLIKGIHLFPIGFWHRIYERLISLCRYRKDHPSYVIDSMGKHIGLGTIPANGLEDIQRVDYDDGFKAPIPIDPKPYLIYDYGKGYLPLPPYCKRQAPHNFARIDLGRYLIDPKCEGPEFRSVDLRGELFEKEV